MKMTDRHMCSVHRQTSACELQQLEHDHWQAGKQVTSGQKHTQSELSDELL